MIRDFFNGLMGTDTEAETSQAPGVDSPDDQRHISDAGLSIIKKFEGLRLKAYRCPAGVLTIGYGHTGNVEEGQEITKEQAEELLRRDLERFEDAVSELITHPIKQHQFDALVSFTYNVGINALRKSTLRRLLNGGDAEMAAREFTRWVRAGGKVLKGLQRRRFAEQQLFIGGA